MEGFQLLSDGQWALIEKLLPVRAGKRGRPFSDARAMAEGIIYRYRCGTARRDGPRRVRSVADDPRPGTDA
ncbi:transposase [Amycolatopsis sp. NPDC051903]|uniref:transposase n=1 Tax=Amycolatopsis sp. NPDC051903 TaxID=3363936 RepID=UPI0037B12F36